MARWIEMEDGTRHGFRDNTTDAQIEAWLTDRYGPPLPMLEMSEEYEARANYFAKERVLVVRVPCGGSYQTIVIRREASSG
jgi:hypothetical protein